jgi:hypothetical protein
MNSAIATLTLTLSQWERELDTQGRKDASDAS